MSRSVASPGAPERPGRAGPEPRPVAKAVHAPGRWAWLPWLGAGLAFVLYLQTLAPGIEFGDAGELVTAAARLWVPHPSGYPLFLLLGHLFAKLPVGSEEFVRLNLMSALFCALGLGFFGSWLKLVLDLACSRAEASAGGRNERRRSKERKRQRGRNAAEPTRPAPRRVSEPARWMIATFGALLLGLSRTFWSLSTSAEVYPIFIVLLAANLYLFLFTCYLREPEVRRQRRIGLIWAFVLGLSFTAHLSTILLAPAFLLAFFVRSAEHLLREAHSAQRWSVAHGRNFGPESGTFGSRWPIRGQGSGSPFNYKGLSAASPLRDAEHTSGGLWGGH